MRLRIKNKLTPLISIFVPYGRLLPLCAGIFIAADDQTVIVTVLPDMLTELRVGANELNRASWAITGYLVGYTAVMPFMGQMSDRFGYRNPFLIALLIFSIGSAAVALSPQLPKWVYGGSPELNWMVGARVFQAIGGGALIPIAIAAAQNLVDKRHRIIGYGLIGVSFEIGSVIGPLWGGGIAELLSWHWVFWFNIPLALLVAIWIARDRGIQRFPVRLDVTGVVLFSIALILSTIALSRVGRPDGVFIITGLSALLTIAILVVHSYSSKSPIFSSDLFGIRDFTLAITSNFLIGSALIIGLVTIPLIAATVYADSTLEGGLRLLRMTVAMGVGALIGGIVTQRLGPTWPIFTGLLLSIIGFLFLSTWDLSTREPSVTIQVCLAGSGFGILFAPLSYCALRLIPVEQKGTGSSLFVSTRMIGMIFGLATITSIGTVQFTGLISDLPAISIDSHVQSEINDRAIEAALIVYNNLFKYGAVALMLAILPSLFLLKSIGFGNGDLPDTN